MKKAILTSIVILFTAFSFAQGPCGSIANNCEKNIADNYISDGQSYRALLVEEEIAEFRATLYGGNTYRIAGCSGMENGNLIFSIYDKDRRPIFTNLDYESSGYWDFEIENTFDCIIEARLNVEKVESGCAVLLIAFEN